MAERKLLDHETFLLMRRTRDFAAENHFEPLSLNRLADEAAFSPFHFQRLFVRAFGESPHEFLTRVRVEEAQKLLRSSDMSVSEICFEVGFQSLGSFSTLFSRHVGCAPSEFRRVFSVPLAWRMRTIPACFGTMWGLY